MVIIAVDDEQLALEALEEAIRQAVPDAALHCFTTAGKAHAYAQANHVDVAFLDISMPEIDGLSLALRMKDVHPAMNVVFITGHSQYASDAFRMHASGYVPKPVNAEIIRREMEALRYPPASPAQSQRVYVQCFGSFAVYVQGALLHFTKGKPKELLAYLVHKNGAGITAAEIASILWEDKVYDRSTRSQVQTVVSQLMAILRGAGIEDIITKKWNSIAINKAVVACDYYAFLDGDPWAINVYLGEYLTNYSWAESAVMQLQQKTKNF